MLKLLHPFRRVKKQSPLSYRVLAYILLFSFVFTLFFTGLQIYSDYKQDVSTVNKSITIVETSYIKSLSSSLWSLDIPFVKIQMEGILALPYIVGIKLKIYPDNEIIVGKVSPKTTIITRTFPLAYQTQKNNKLGKLTVIASMSGIYDTLKMKVIFILATETIKTFFISIFIILIFQYLVTRHLKKMAAYARKIRIGTLNKPLILDRGININNQNDELTQVTDALNSMRVTLIQDLETQRQSQTEIHKLSTAIDQSPTSIFICNTDWIIEYVNKKYIYNTGKDREKLIGYPPETLTRSQSVESRGFWASIQSRVEKIGFWKDEIHSRYLNGKQLWEQLIVTPIENNNGKIINYLVMAEDISVRKRYEQQLLRQANYDILTGLPNRMLALDRLTIAVNHAKRENKLVGLMFLDLDNFKHINDTMGHDSGDTLLIEASKRISTCLRGSSTVARLGGDEFLVILPDLKHPEDTEQVANRILNTFKPAFFIQKQEVFIGTSIGIALYPTDSDDTTLLMQNADSAMYRAKNLGKSTFQRFTPDMQQQSKERLQIEKHLRHALKLNEFELFYQPIVEVANGKLIGTEALIRWNSPSIGSIPPDKFIPLAEENGLIIPIGEWVLDTACRDIKRWKIEHDIDIRVAVNVSPRQFKDARFLDMLDDIIKSNAISASSLELEITERLILDDTIETAKILGALHAKGTTLSIDDFGTGYSALGYLKSYPFDTLKIDKSFIQDVNNEPEDAALVTAIISMAHSLSLTVIAEGVEEAHQLSFLRKNGCDCAQGYFYSRPAPENEFIEWLLMNSKS